MERSVVRGAEGGGDLTDSFEIDLADSASVPIDLSEEVIVDVLRTALIASATFCAQVSKSSSESTNIL